MFTSQTSKLSSPMASLSSGAYAQPFRPTDPNSFAHVCTRKKLRRSQNPMGKSPLSVFCTAKYCLCGFHSEHIARTFAPARACSTHLIVPLGPKKLFVTGGITSKRRKYGCDHSTYFMTYTPTVLCMYNIHCIMYLYMFIYYII